MLPWGFRFLPGGEVAKAQLVVFNGRNARIAIPEIVQRNQVTRKIGQSQMVFHAQVGRALLEKRPLQLPVQVGAFAVGPQHHPRRELPPVGQRNAVVVGGRVKRYFCDRSGQKKRHPHRQRPPVQKLIQRKAAHPEATQIERALQHPSPR